MDGLKIEYTEGILTASLHIRTNEIDYDTNYEVQKFVDYAKDVFKRENTEAKEEWQEMKKFDPPKDRTPEGE